MNCEMRLKRRVHRSESCSGLIPHKEEACGFVMPLIDLSNGVLKYLPRFLVPSKQ
uniref:Uncharacterized protein n=1 Tax=Anguilla anguilla TaxID=7936 RepID=A0A0E9X5H6_ANGAN